MASNTRQEQQQQHPYDDPYAGGYDGGSAARGYTPAPGYEQYDTTPQLDYNDRTGGGGGYGHREEEILRDQYPPRGDLGAHQIYEHDQNRLHPSDPYEYDNPYTPQSDGHGAGGSTIGPWDSASQRSFAATTVMGTDPQRPHLRNKPSTAGLSYIDEEGAYYKSNTQRPASEFMPVAEIEMRGLVHDPSPMAGRHHDGERERDVEFDGIKGNDYDTSPLASYPTNQNQMPKYQKPSGVYSWLLFPTGLDRVLAIFGVNMGRLPLEQEIERKRRGIAGQRFPIAAWSLTVSEYEYRSLSCAVDCYRIMLTHLVMTALMVYELVRNNQLTGSVIATSPQFNYMIGPSSEVLINIGARFIPSVDFCPTRSGLVWC